LHDRGVHTIADVARLAGVAKSTVSRALNDSPLIAAETKERIRAIAAEHHFEMNVPARRLSTKLSHVVALVTYEYDLGYSVGDAFMLEIMSGISRALHASDYDLLVIHVGPGDTEWVRRYLDSGRVDGFILLSATCTEEHLRTLVETKAPFIIWSVPPGDHGYCSVTGDSFAGGMLATRHLLRSGRDRIAFLGGPEWEPEAKERFHGYEAALRDAGRRIDPACIVYADWGRPETEGASAMRHLLDVAPDLDAVFVSSDLMAIAAIDELREHGRRVPDDVAVVGYDDVAMARYSNPPLTTIRQDGPLAGRLLAENLLQYLQKGVVTSVRIPAELVLRESA
jgi:DNA-binding LacI/PurR family transcriptional regulator